MPDCLIPAKIFQIFMQILHDVEKPLLHIVSISNRLPFNKNEKVFYPTNTFLIKFPFHWTMVTIFLLLDEG